MVNTARWRLNLYQWNSLLTQVSYDHSSYELNLSNCIQEPEKVRTSTYFIYQYTLTDSVRLIHAWKVVGGHSLPFDVFFGTMTGVELFPGRDVFNSLDTQNLAPFSRHWNILKRQRCQSLTSLSWDQTSKTHSLNVKRLQWNSQPTSKVSKRNKLCNSGTLFYPTLLTYATAVELSQNTLITSLRMTRRKNSEPPTGLFSVLANWWVVFFLPLTTRHSSIDFQTSHPNLRETHL